MTTLVAWLIEGTLVAAVAAAAITMVPRASASARYLCWCAVLGLILALPLMPPLPLAAPSQPAAASRVSTPHALVAPAASTAAINQEHRALFTLPEPSFDVTLAAAALWLAVTLFMFGRLALGVSAMRRLGRDAQPLGKWPEQAMPLWSASKTARRPAALYESKTIPGACALGFVRPRILIASRLAGSLTAPALEAVVLHEQAHLSRYDDWTRLLQQLVLALVGFHPAVRFVCRQIDRERESACDDEVVRRVGNPTLYARALADVAAQSGRMSWRFASIPAAVGTRAALRNRVERLLVRKPASRWQLWSGSIAAAASLLLVAATVTNLPPLIAVEAVALPMAAIDRGPTTIGVLHLLHAAATADETGLQQPAAPAATPEEPVAETSSAQRAPVAERSAPAPAADVAPADAVPNVVERLDVSEPAVAVWAPLVAAPFTTAPIALPPDPSTDMEPEDSSAAQWFVDAGAAIARASVATGDAASRAGIVSGNAASRAGVVTGLASSRAGVSIGRFFSRGGTAFARRMSSAASSMK